MESATDPGEFERAQRAFMARIARMVLPDGQGIDRRDAMVLIDCDVIRPDETEESEDSIDRLRKGPTEATSTGLGPLYFYPGESGGQAVVRARDLLLDRRREVRQIAIAHLEKTAESADSMSRPTRKALERLTPVLTSEGWRGAAIELVDALDNDWLLNLAGMNQCRVPALQELWSEYVNAALRPPIASVQGCSPAILCPSLHQEAMNSCAARLRQGTQSLVALCSEYIETVGHVPVGGDCSLGRTLMARAGEESLSERLRTVLEWAAKSGSPFARYHACEAALSSAAQLSQEQREQVATWFWEAALPAAGTAKPTKSQAAWALAGQLARYYVQYLEVRLPSDHGEAVAAMAWWMTVRLMAVTRGGVGPTRDFGGQLDRVYGAFAAEIWDVVGPPMAPSILRWLTAFGPSPWILSLMSAVESADDVKWLMAGPGPGTQEDRANVLIALAMQIANVPFEEGQYRFTQTARRVLGWAAADELDESKRAVLTAWAEGIDWSPPESLANALEALDQQESPISAGCVTPFANEWLRAP